jgi:hypothetical protein
VVCWTDFRRLTKQVLEWRWLTQGAQHDVDLLPEGLTLWHVNPLVDKRLGHGGRRYYSDEKVAIVIIRDGATETGA